MRGYKLSVAKVMVVKNAGFFLSAYNLILAVAVLIEYGISGKVYKS